MESVRHLGQQEAIERSTNSIPGRLLGLAIVSLVPALFWTLALALIGPAIGIAFSMQTLLLVGLLIASLLSLVFSALALSSDPKKRR